MSQVRTLFALLLLALPAASQIFFDREAIQTNAGAPAASNTPAAERCVLSGRVSNSLTGEPVKKATIRLMPAGGTPPGLPAGRAGGQPAARQGYAATSQPDGSFSLENIEPGDYFLSGRRTGYLDTQFGARRAMSLGTVLSLKPGQQKTDINLSLIPQAVIIGKVVDEDGDPMNGVSVQAVRRQWQQGRMRDLSQAGTTTNDLGEYRLSGVRPGKLWLIAQPMNFDHEWPQLESSKSERRPVRTFYPEAISRDTAAPIEVQPGQDLSGIDIRVHSAQTYHVRGKVAGLTPEGDGPGPRGFVSVHPRDDSFGGLPNAQSMVSNTHSFDIPGVVPGSYDLVLQTMGGRNRVPNVGRQPIDVGAGDLNDVVIGLQTAASVRGSVRVEGTPSATASVTNLNNIHFRLMPYDMGSMFGPIPDAAVGADGTFTLENVAAGKYMLNFNGPNGVYLESVRIGSQELRGKYIDYSGGAGGELDIVLRYGGAEVDATVQGAQNANASEPAQHANILLVPEEMNEDGSGMKFNSVGSGGNAAFKQLPPGRYKAYAFEDASFADLQNPDVLKQLEGKGTDVEVKGNETKQVQLPLISTDEFLQVLTKLGLDLSQ